VRAGLRSRWKTISTARNSSNCWTARSGARASRRPCSATNSASSASAS
jgi:hypothetical protein